MRETIGDHHDTRRAASEVKSLDLFSRCCFQNHQICVSAVAAVA
jgi:hypothetical protein